MNLRNMTINYSHFIITFNDLYFIESVLNTSGQHMAPDSWQDWIEQIDFYSKFSSENGYFLPAHLASRKLPAASSQPPIASRIRTIFILSRLIFKELFLLTYCQAAGVIMKFSF